MFWGLGICKRIKKWFGVSKAEKILFLDVGSKNRIYSGVSEGFYLYILTSRHIKQDHYICPFVAVDLVTHETAEIDFAL